MTALWQDVRFGLRMLRRNPGFTGVAVLTLALGIGANTTVFTLVNAVIFSGLPFHNADRYVTVWSNNLSKGQERMGVSFQDLEDMRAQSKTLKGLAAFGPAAQFVSEPGQPPTRYNGSRVSANTFSLIGQKPMLGRDFLPGEDALSGPAVVIIAYELWQSRFAGDPEIIGKTIRINEDPKTIVGVMPPGVKFPYNDDLWFPFRPSEFTRREVRGMPVFGVLADGVSMEAAQTELSLIAKRLEEQYPTTNKGIGVSVQSYSDFFLWGNIRLLFMAMLGAVAFVLLIACANVGNLLLSRAVARTKEIAIRSSLGAGRGQIVRQLLVESFLLGLLGGAGGLLLSVWGVRAFEAAT